MTTGTLRLGGTSGPREGGLDSTSDTRLTKPGVTLVMDNKLPVPFYLHYWQEDKIKTEPHVNHYKSL